jgi:hypothetical protein
VKEKTVPSPRSLGLLAAIAALATATPAFSQPVTCGFDSPAFHLGGVNAQQGWGVTPADVPPSAASVVATPRDGGDHALRLSQAAYGSEFYTEWGCAVGLAPSQDGLDVQWRMNLQDVGGYGWVVELRASNNVPFAWLWIDAGNMWYRVWGVEPQLADGFMTAGAWHTMNIRLDWTARSTTFLMDGQVIAGGAWHAAPSRTLGTFSVRAVVGGGTDAVVFDSFVITRRGGCSGDYNSDGVVSSQDFFDFLNDFFPARAAADVNHDGAVNSQDFFDFLVFFFTGC